MINFTTTKNFCRKNLLRLVKYLLNLNELKMKKLIFSAVALVAFSGVSIAKNIPEKQIKIENEIKTEKKIGNKENVDDGAIECYKRASYFVDGMDPYNELSGVAANNMYQNFFNYCMKMGW